MSATNRGAERVEGDFYSTPTKTSRAILRLHPVEGLTVLEPGAGSGALVEELLRAKAHHVVAVENDAARCTQLQARFPDRDRVTVVEADFLGGMTTRLTRDIDVAVGNPPFSLALQFIEKARAIARARTTMLLRIGFLGSQERSRWHRANPSDLAVLDRRPEFVMSVTCRAKCGYRVTLQLPLVEKRPSICPRCASIVTTSTSDSSEYAWFTWGRLYGGHWSILDTSDPDTSA